MVERLPVKERVVGSNPTRGAELLTLFFVGSILELDNLLFSREERGNAKGCVCTDRG